MGKAKVVDGKKLSILIPAEDLKRLKIEAVQRDTLESSIVLEALRLHWAQGTPTSTAHVSVSAEFMPSSAAPVPESRKQIIKERLPLVDGPPSHSPEPLDAAPGPTPAPKTPAEPVLKVSKAVVKPKPRQPGKPLRKETGDRELLQCLETLRGDKKLEITTFMKVAAPGIGHKNYYSWLESGRVPALHVPLVREYLKQHGCERMPAEQPATGSQV